MHLNGFARHFEMTCDFFSPEAMNYRSGSTLVHLNSLRPSDAYICGSNLTIIGSDNGLLPDRHQVIIWTNVGILLIGPLGTKCSEILIKIHAFSFKKMYLKMSSGKWRPFCFDCNALTACWLFAPSHYQSTPMLTYHLGHRSQLL